MASCRSDATILYSSDYACCLIDFITLPPIGRTMWTCGVTVVLFYTAACDPESASWLHADYADAAILKQISLLDWVNLIASSWSKAEYAVQLQLNLWRNCGSHRQPAEFDQKRTLHNLDSFLLCCLNYLCCFIVYFLCLSLVGHRLC